MGHSGTPISAIAAAIAASALILIALVAPAAWGQAAPQSPKPPSALQSSNQQTTQSEPVPEQSDASPSSPDKEDNPGLFNQMGKLFEKSLSVLPKIKGPSETLENLNARARDAGESLSNLARPSSIVTGRMGCAVAANGAPDCNAGADRLCQSKGFKQGKSLDTDAAEKCSAKVFLPGHKREPGDCRTENYVTRAVCQ